MANSTPSSVVNELAKNNKVSPIYQLINETGPAHQKVFTVHLKIGGHGPFEGVGSSLKNARNAAASRALVEGAPGLRINPTVELNILSMKSGEMAIYRELDSVSLPSRSVDHYDSLFMSQQYRLQRPFNSRLRKLWRMSVTICGRTYVGEGHTKPEARANAASHALLELKPILLEQAKRVSIELAKKQQALQEGNEKIANNKLTTSFVSELHELANKHDLEVIFTIIDETGPPHIRVFQVQCKVKKTQREGSTLEKDVIGQGLGKRAAKNDAAEKMLSCLKDLPAVDSKKKGFKGHSSKKSKKEKIDHGIDVSLDAITYLKQLLQLRKEPQVDYTLKADAGPQQKGLMRFQIEAAVGEFKAAGYGETKKAAKLNAATNLLKALGIDLQELRKVSGVKEVKEEDDYTDVLNAAMESLSVTRSPIVSSTLNRAPGSPVSCGRVIKLNVTKLLDINEKDLKTAKDKLEFIARMEGFKIMFNDFITDERSGQYTCSLALFTNPPERFTGLGTNVETSREHAARKALDTFIYADSLKAPTD